MDKKLFGVVMVGLVIMSLICCTFTFLMVTSVQERFEKRIQPLEISHSNLVAYANTTANSENMIFAHIDMRLRNLEQSLAMVETNTIKRVTTQTSKKSWF